MSMFDNYKDEISVTSNLFPPKKVINKIYNFELPIAVINSKGEVITYKWSDTDIFNLPLTVNDELLIPSDSVILTEHGLIPDGKGTNGVRAYNLVDRLSWQWKDNGWNKDESLTIPSGGTKAVQFTYDMTNATMLATIENFRCEPIYNWEFHTASAEVQISKEKYPLLVQGTYNLLISIKNNQGTILLKRIPISIGEYPISQLNKYLKDTGYCAYNIPDYIANRLTPIINSFDNGKWLHAVNGEWKADYLVIGDCVDEVYFDE